jgi:hypothetical protein
VIRHPTKKTHPPVIRDLELSVLRKVTAFSSMSAESRTDEIANTQEQSPQPLPQQEEQQQQQKQQPSLTDNHLAHIRDTLKDATLAVTEEELAEFTEQSIYYDAETMAPMNALSAVSPAILCVHAFYIAARGSSSAMALTDHSHQAAIARLRAYKPPPFPLWDSLSARRRAAVLILLYADRWGDLRVVITMRAASLRSFSGHAALPGGKADSEEETPCEFPSLSCALLGNVTFITQVVACRVLI